MRLDELKNEQAIEALADMFDPIMQIASDEDVKLAAQSGNTALMVKKILKGHSRSVMEIMAIMDGVPVTEYECNMLTLPAKLIELFNRPEFTVLFQSQSQIEETPSGSATESTKVKGK